MDVLGCNIAHDGRSKACHEKSAEAIVVMREHHEGLNKQIPFKEERSICKSERREKKAWTGDDAE